ncbi:helix-turn-helix domain-containing protein [Agreia sp.]|uniref:helix-turn-helix domain-containing protein n=1 Tax=Agreia sp. TaxID=1872416 RepID=UPI0035BBB994
MRRIIEETVGGPLSDERVDLLACGFWTQVSSVFHFDSQQRVLGRTQVMQSTQSALRVRGRDEQSAGLVHIGFILNGGCEIGPDEHASVQMGRGGVYVVPDGGSYNLTAPGPTRSLSIRMPEQTLHDRGIRLTHNKFRAGDNSSLGPPLREFAAAIADVSWRPSRPGLLVAERTVEDLIVGMFLESAGYSMDAEELRLGLRERALAVINEKHRDPTLNPLAVAMYLGVSLRHLQRAFQDSDSSVAVSIARARSATAALFLSSPRTVSLTLNELSARSGFASTFEFRSAFKQHYRVLPSEFRLGVRRTTTADLPIGDGGRLGRVMNGEGSARETTPVL